MADFKKMRKYSTERISQSFFYVLMTISVLAFVLYYLVGFNTPSLEDPNFTAPLLTDVLLVLMIVALVVSIAVTAVAVFVGLRKRNPDDRTVNGVPASLISWITVGVTFALLVVTFLLGSTRAMTINGREYADVVMLKLSDMFVSSSLVMILLAVGTVLFGYTRYIRRRNK